MNLLNTISEISWPELIPVGLLFLCGLVLLTAGRRVMRAGFASAGLLIGGVLGAVVGEAGNLGVEPWICGASGAVVFTVIAALAYKLALAASVGLLLAILAPMGVWTAEQQEYVTFGAPLSVEPEQPVLASGPLIDNPDAEGGGDDVTTGGDEGETIPVVTDDGGTLLSGSVQETIDRSRERLDEIIEDARQEPLATAATADDSEIVPILVRPFAIGLNMASDALRDSPARLRGTFLASAVFGLMVGVVIGAAAPILSATVVSSLGGSFLLLASGWIIGVKQFGAVSLLPSTPTQWTLTWLIIAILGLGVQWMFRPKRADKSAAE